MQHRIPKRIIQTGRDVHRPLRNLAAKANIRLLNPDYEYLVFDDAQGEEFVNQEFPRYGPVFDSFRQTSVLRHPQP
jgi:mannosyltransferase OCH1-like enzyme